MSMMKNYSDRVRQLSKQILGESSKFISEQGSDYEEFFKSALEKFNVSSPDELGDKKDEFFDFVDKNWDAGDAETDLDEAFMNFEALEQDGANPMDDEDGDGVTDRVDNSTDPDVIDDELDADPLQAFRDLIRQEINTILDEAPEVDEPSTDKLTAPDDPALDKLDAPADDSSAKLDAPADPSSAKLDAPTAEPVVAAPSPEPAADEPAADEPGDEPEDDEIEEAKLSVAKKGHSGKKPFERKFGKNKKRPITKEGLKKSDLRKIIRETLSELNEGVKQNQILDVIKQHGDSEFKMSLKVMGQNGAATNWLNVDKDVVVKLASMIKD